MQQYVTLLCQVSTDQIERSRLRMLVHQTPFVEDLGKDVLDRVNILRVIRLMLLMAVLAKVLLFEQAEVWRHLLNPQRVT